MGHPVLILFVFDINVQFTISPLNFSRRTLLGASDRDLPQAAHWILFNPGTVFRVHAS